MNRAARFFGIVLAAGALLCASVDGQADTLLVVRKSADALDFLDPGSGLRLASVGVGSGPHEVDVSPDGRLAVVPNYGTRERPGSSLSVVDLEQPRELRRIDLAPHTRPHGVAWYAGDRVAVTTEGSRHLLVVDPLAGRIVAAIPTGQEGTHMVAVAPGGQRAYAANIGSGSVSAVTLAGTAADVRTVETGAGTEAIAVRPDGREVWVAAREDGALLRLDALTLAPISRVALTGEPIRVAFAPDGATAYVTCAASAELVAFDTASGLERGRRTIDVPLAADGAVRSSAGTLGPPGSPLPVGLAVAPDGRSVFVAATRADRVVQLDATTLQVVRVIDVPGEPDGLASTPVLPQPQCHACTAD